MRAAQRRSASARIVTRASACAVYAPATVVEYMARSLLNSARASASAQHGESPFDAATPRCAVAGTGNRIGIRRHMSPLICRRRRRLAALLFATATRSPLFDATPMPSCRFDTR